VAAPASGQVGEKLSWRAPLSEGTPIYGGPPPLFGTFTQVKSHVMIHGIKVDFDRPNRFAFIKGKLLAEVGATIDDTVAVCNVTTAHRTVGNCRSQNDKALIESSPTQMIG